MLNTDQQGKPTPIRVVLVDDHGIFRAGLEMLFEKQPDLELVGQAEDGESALPMIRQLKPDVLLLDLALPKRSGMDVLADLHHLESPVKTIILTAAIDRKKTVEAVQLGARGLVLKEATSELLFKAIRSVMAGEYWVDRGRVSELAEALYTSVREPVTAPSQNSFRMTPRERQIVAAVLSGYSNRDIAQKLSISGQTVKNHLTQIYDKVGVSSRLELALCVSKQPFDDRSS
jgi:two-component system, NarL family, nitrate/nitrite response regulator NarL